MSTPSAYDLIIIGGGCAGLSLASNLAKLPGNVPKVLVLEQRLQYRNDRTWCFWDTANAACKSLVTHAWPTFRIKDKQQDHAYDALKHPYLMLASDVFYNQALADIDRCSYTQLLLGEEIIGSAVKVNQAWQVKTASGEYSAKWLVDTRPHRDTMESDSVLWQSFFGQEIALDEAHFDADQCVLMDFDDGFASGLAFIYFLPTSAKQALIEYTVFSEHRYNKEALQPLLMQAVAQYTGEMAHRVVREECGVLPMGNKRILAHQDPSYVFAGLYAGGARPSSGYAFQRIQAWAQACAVSMVEQNRLLAFAKDKWLQRHMDDLFLYVIKSQPKMASSLFKALFKHCPLPALVRFMSDQASLYDAFCVMKSLPTFLFIQSLPRYLLHKLSKH
jgi:lycopene beta-cyclase